MIQNISFIGMDKLGLPFAASMADSGFRVHGLDLNPEFADAVNNGRAPFFEPGLGRLVGRIGGKTLTVSQGELSRATRRYMLKRHYAES